MLIIGFGHKARRGKDTAVQAIIEARGKDFDVRRYAFADPLKKEYTQEVEETMHRFHCSEQEAVRHLCARALVEYDPNADMTDPLCPYGKQRKLLQWWGTEYRRAQDRNYWVKKMIATLEAERPQVALIPDMRFWNELHAIRVEKFDRKGFAVRLDRVGFEEAQATGHVSENELDAAIVGKHYDYALEVEDGDVEGLKRGAVLIFDDIVNSMRPPTDFSLAYFEGVANAADSSN